jgi:hypothetical protein
MKYDVFNERLRSATVLHKPRHLKGGLCRVAVRLTANAKKEFKRTNQEAPSHRPTLVACWNGKDIHSHTALFILFANSLKVENILPYEHLCRHPVSKHATLPTQRAANPRHVPTILSARLGTFLSPSRIEDFRFYCRNFSLPVHLYFYSGV